MIKEQMPSENYSVIIGGQEASTRLKEIQKFQEGETDIMLSMVTAGGTGISLHDTKGGRRRYVLVSPPESATQTIQCLGRADRIGSKSDSVQRIIFIAGTIEEKIAENLGLKIQTISDLNNDDVRADNLFLFDEVHKMEHNDVIGSYGDDDDEPVDTNQPPKVEKAATIQIGLDRANDRFYVTVPDYMVDAFERGIPVEARVAMSIAGEKYYFNLKLLPIVKEFLQKLNV
jgi:superfamily II DNA or RNA helicase